MTKVPKNGDTNDSIKGNLMKDLFILFKWCIFAAVFITDIVWTNLNDHTSKI